VFCWILKSEKRAIVKHWLSIGIDCYVEVYQCTTQTQRDACFQWLKWLQYQPSGLTDVGRHENSIAESH